MGNNLERMAEVAAEEASHHRASASHYREQYIDAPMHEHHRQRAEDLEGLAKLARIMGTFEDKSRKFVASLLEEHGR